jgi:hypothetical protein
MNSKLDILISRVVDGVARPEDWDALEQLGATDSSVWRELAQAQRAEQVFKAAACEAVAAVDHIELPPVGLVHAEHRLKFRARQVASWSGWAAAAALALAFLGRAQIGPSGPGSQAASILPFATADQAYEQYLAQGKKEGKVLGEMPQRVLVDTVQMPDGRLRVVFLRQIIEQKTLDELRQLSNNEAGEQCLVRVPIVVAKNPKNPT